MQPTIFSPPSDRKRKLDAVVNNGVLSPKRNGAEAGTVSSAKKRAKPSTKALFAAPVAGEDTPGPAPVPRGRKTEARKQRDRELDMVTLAKHEAWRDNFRRKFPELTFYFDAIDPSKAADLRESIEELKGNVAIFFDKSVTHVITSRAIPAAVVQPSLLELEGSNVGTENKENVSTTARAVPGFSRRRSPIKPTTERGVDVLVKAGELGIKIWDISKSERFLRNVVDGVSPVKPKTGQAKMPLDKMLHYEAKTGLTTERDPNVLHPDFHWFPTTHCYVLSEDTTGTYRTILQREWKKPRRGDEPEWPVLWGGADGRCAFSLGQTPVPLPPMPRGPVAKLQAHGGVGLLKRAISLDQLSKRTTAGTFGGLAPPAMLDDSIGVESSFLPAQPPAARQPSVFQAASGNAISSRIASMTSNAPRSAYSQAGVTAMGGRLAELSRRPTVSLSGGGQGRLLALPGALRRTASVDTGLNAARPPPREAPPKAGYCENCRIKFDDFKEHVKSRKHRKFAEKASNWVLLDQCIARTERPLSEGYKATLIFNSLLPPDDESEEEEDDGDDVASSCPSSQRRRRVESYENDDDSMAVDVDEDEDEAEEDEDDGQDENRAIVIDSNEEDDE